jgi:hypothetical protein
MAKEMLSGRPPSFILKNVHNEEKKFEGLVEFH